MIPEPKDLPPQATEQARRLTDTMRGMESDVKNVYDDSIIKVQQNNTSLQALTEQVDVLKSYIGALPADGRTYSAQATSFNLTAGTNNTMASLSVPMNGFSNVTMFVVADGVIVDTGTPYFTACSVRIVVDGVATQGINSSYAYYGSPPRDLFHMAETFERSGSTSSITVQVQANPDQAVTGNGDSFARICVFAIYT